MGFSVGDGRAPQCFGVVLFAAEKRYPQCDRGEVVENVGGMMTASASLMLFVEGICFLLLDALRMYHASGLLCSLIVMTKTFAISILMHTVSRHIINK